MYRTIRTFLITFLIVQLLRSTFWIWMEISEITSKNRDLFTGVANWQGIGSPGYITHAGLSNGGFTVGRLFVDVFDQQNQPLKKLRSTVHVTKKTVPPHKLAKPLTGRRVFGSSLGWKATMASSGTAAWSSSKMADTKRCSSAMQENYTPKNEHFESDRSPLWKGKSSSKPSFWGSKC